MRIRSTFAPAAAAALLCLPMAAEAGDTHTITPHFPDSFKVRTTVVSDQAQDSQGQKQTTHAEIEASGAVTKTGDVFHGTYQIDRFDMSSQGPDGKPTPQAAEQAEILAALKDIGAAQVTFDTNLDPVRVDNIDEIKARLKATLTASKDPEQAKGGEMVYNLMLANLTPESAAAMMRQSKQASNYFNVPLTLNTAVRVDQAPLEFMGAKLRSNTTMTLTGWEEGKTARLHYVMAPTEEDMQTFLGGIIQAMIGSMVEGQDEKTREVMKRMIDNMHMAMTVTCDVDVDLSNYIGNRQVCDTTTHLTMDMKKIVPPEVLKDNPAAADQLPVITQDQTSRSVSTTVVVP